MTTRHLAPPRPFRHRAVITGLTFLVWVFAASAQALYTPGGTVGNIGGDKVGIGTASPTQKLTIRRAAGASATADFSIGNGTQWLQMNSQLATGSYNPMVRDGDLALYYSAGTQNTGGLFIGQWSSSPRGLRIDPDGNIGVGIGLPTERLHISSNTAGQSERIKIESQNIAGLELISDRANLAGEPGGAYIQLSQDAGGGYVVCSLRFRMRGRMEWVALSRVRQ